MKKSEKIIININNNFKKPVTKANSIITPKKGKGSYSRKNSNSYIPSVREVKYGF